MTNREDVEIGLKFKVEESLANRALRVLDDIREAEKRAEAQIKEVTEALKERGATEKEIKRVTAALREQEKQTLRNAAANEKASAVSQPNKGRGGSFSFQQVGQVAGGLGLGQVSNAAGLIDDVGGLAAGLGGLGAAAIPATLGIAALAGGLTLLQKASEDAAKAEQRRIDMVMTDLARQQSNFEASQSMSTTQLDKYVNTLEQQADETNRVIALREKEIETEIRRRMQGQFTEKMIVDRIAIEKQNDKELQQLIERRGNENAAIGNADKVLRKLIEAREREQGIINDIVGKNDRQMEAYKLAQTASSEDIKKRIDDLQLEMEFNAKTRGEIIKQVREGKLSSEEAGEVLAELNKQYQDNAAWVKILTNVTLGIVEAREREAKAIAAQKKMINDAFASMSKYADATKRISDLQAEAVRNAELDRREREFGALEQQIEAAKEMEARIVTEDRKAEITREYMQDELEATRDFQAEMAKINTDGQNRIIDILENAQFGIAEAIFNNDVKQFTAAIRQRDFDLKRAARDQGIAVGDAVGGFTRDRQRAAEQYQMDLAQQQQANVERIKLSEQLEKQLSDLRERYARIDAENARKVRDETLNKALADAQSEATKQAQIIIKPVNMVIDTIKDKISQIASLLTPATSVPTVRQGTLSFVNDAARGIRGASATNITNIYINGTKVTSSGGNQSKVIAAARSAALVFQNQLGA